MNIQDLSSKYFVRKLENDDIEDIYHLSVEQDTYYHYHHQLLNRQSIKDDMLALPPNTQKENKYYLGFYQDDHLIAIIDLILHYPKNNVAFIGLFMVSQDMSKQGIGTQIIKDSIEYLKKHHYDKVRLAIDKDNPQSYAFWRKNGFIKTGEEIIDGENTYYPMEIIIEDKC